MLGANMTLALSMPTKGTKPHELARRPTLTGCRKEAIQKTIMSMTLGKDVSALFPDVLKNIATGDLDQKKLVYLYLMCALDPRYPCGSLISLGITPNLIPTSAFSL